MEFNQFKRATIHNLLMLHHLCFHKWECLKKKKKKCENVMRLDNPVLVPQHEQPGLLFWSASLVGNNEWGAQWRHTGNHPHF